MIEDLCKHKSEGMKCKTCMFYVPKNNLIGRCRESAPTLKGWPAIFPDDWCGAHKLDADKLLPSMKPEK